MGRLIATEFVTLDGVAQAPGAPEEDRETDFTLSGSQAPPSAQDSGNTMFMKASKMDAHTTRRYWPPT